MKGNFHYLKVYELDKYLSYHGLMKKGKKEDKVKTVMHHELRNKDPVKIKSIAKLLQLTMIMIVITTIVMLIATLILIVMRKHLLFQLTQQIPAKKNLRI